MPRLLQIIGVTLMLLAPWPVQAFSLLGPLTGAPGGEAWQVAGLGYNPGGGEIGAPKNLTEEYRWNTPVITYGFDNSFLNYFGTNGVAAVDEAFAILNSLPHLDSLSRELAEYPLFDPFSGASTTFRDSRRVNLRAEANNLVDLKSVALGLIIEELGLASPERWSWALRDRRTFGTPPVTNYLVIQRNFDPVTLRPTPYVNGNRYTYEIFEFENPTFADAIEAPVDPEHRVHAFSAVATISGGLFDTGLGAGVFYTYLTRDDIGGLRYLYSTNNLNWEPFAPGTEVFSLNRSALVSVTNQDLTLFSLRSLTSPPLLMSNFYPGLIITEAIPGAEQIVSNFPVVITQTVDIVFQTNFSTPLILSNIDLTTFSSFTLTSAPPQLLAAFPDLVIASTNFSFALVPEIESIVLTNAQKEPWSVPFETNFIFVTNFVTNVQTRFHYSFANVITNYFSPINRVRREITGIDKEPWSTALNPIYKTNIQDFIVQEPSGGLLIVPTNLLGFEFIPTVRATNIIANTNIVMLTNFVDINGIQRTISNIEYRFFTNVQYPVFPIEFLPNPIRTNILVVQTNVTTNIVTFTYEFANVITNYSGPNTPATRVRYEIVPSPVSPFLNQTNIVSLAPEIIQVPSGGFIIDTNQTGFEFVSAATNLVTVTNVVFDVTDPNTGQRLVEELVYTFTNVVYQVFPFELLPAPPSLLRPGVGKLTFRRIGGDVFTGNSFLFTNRFQATFYTNAQLRTNVFVQVQTLPDILFGAADLGTLADSVRPVQSARSANFVSNAALNSTIGTRGGPGNIFGTVNITFSTIGPTLINQFPGFVTEASALQFTLVQPWLWGRFDGSTNPPIVFPQDISLEEIELLTTGGAVP